MVIGILGVYLGILVEQKYMGTNKFHFWNRTGVFLHIVRFILFVILAFIPLFGHFFVLKQGRSYLFTVIFRKIMPPAFGYFYMFGLCKWIFYKLGLINERISDKNDDIVFFASNSA